NVEELNELKELNLGNNNIHHIENALQNIKNLKSLNLSGNPIYNIKDLCHLANIESLKYLQFADLLYGECPIVQMCNYRPYAVYNLPNLEELDTFTITTSERQQVEDFYRIKMAFYTNSYQQLLNTHYSELENKDKENRDVTAQFRECLFIYNLKEIEKKKNPEMSKETCHEHIKTKLAHLPLNIKKWDNVLSEWKAIKEEDIKVKQCELNYELKTAGNITFNEFSEDCELKNSYQALLTHFLCSHTQRKYGVGGIQLQKVIQIKNKGLELLWRSLKINRKKHMRPTFMILHSPQPASKQTTWPFQLCEIGFVAMKEYKLEITDCVNFNDLAWFKQTTKKKSLLSALSYEHTKQRHVCLIVKFPSHLKLKRIRKQARIEDGNNLTATEERFCSIFQVSDPKAVIPICMLEYQYIIENSLETFKRRMGWTCDIHAAQLSQVSLPTYLVLDEMSILKILPQDTNYDQLTELTLSGCGIKTIGTLPKYPNVKILNMSCNELTNLSELNAFPNLKYLDISFNSIYSLENSQNIPCLETLNISWNQMIKLLDCISCLKNQTPELLNLNISRNPFDITEKDHVFYLIHQQLPNLEILNDIKIMNSFLQNAITVDLKSDDLLTKGRTIPQILHVKETQLKWKAEICNEIKTENINRKKITKNDTSLKWISLTQKYIVSIKQEDTIKETLWADFSHNLINDLNFLAKGVMLQELSLKHNVIQELGTWLHNLKNLVKLDLSCNYITTLKYFYGSSYPSLKVLNVSKNWIKNLNGIEKCEVLDEFYASHNQLAELDDLHGIQNCKALKIIDLSSNPLQGCKELSKFITFHLSKIEMLSGSCIHTNDAAETAEVFGGCLDEEYFLRYHSVEDHKNMTELTLKDCQLKKINIHGDLLPNLTSLHLENNKISSLWNFRVFPNLETLRLSYNHVTHMKHTSDSDDEKKCKLFFPSLKTLFLDNNGIINLNTLRLNSIKKLETLFLHDNELINIYNLQELQFLQNLVLDRNKLECNYSEEFSRFSQIKEIYLEDNKIQNLQFLRSMKLLERVFIGKNDISDPEELKNCKMLKNLHEIGLLGNPMCHKINYYLAINLYIPNVTIVDGADTTQLSEQNHQ
ncbi:hypothetical protein L9F63_016166, partial [Diploptera punctata]